MRTAQPIRSVYVSHNSIHSPLVRSQVLPYLQLLRHAGVEPYVLTFESKGQVHAGATPDMPWHGIPKRRGSDLATKVIDVLIGVAFTLWVCLRHRAVLIHARSYVAAAIAAVVAALTGRPFIFDMRGFLGDEYVEGGHWTAHDLRYRVLRRAEAILLRRAASVVVLTHAAETRLRLDPHYAPLRISERVTVIPCAVDLQRFRPLPERGEQTLVYSGSLAGWYLLDEMLAVYANAIELMPGLRFLLLNRDEQGHIRAAIERSGMRDARIEVFAADPDEMPSLLARCHVGIVLSRARRSIGSSPVKAAEYLAVGLPVVVSASLGDLDDQIRRYRAGHVVPNMSEGALIEAGREVARLVNDEGSRRAARKLAEDNYGLRDASANYLRIYERLARR